MRLRAGIGLILLGSGGCSTLPALVRIQVDDEIVEIERKPKAPAENGQAPDAAER